MPSVPKPTRTASQRGKAAKRKGSAGEREWAAIVPGGERVPLSGALGGKLSGDVTDSAGMTYEVKVRRSGMGTQYGWLEIEPGHGVATIKRTKAVEDGRKRAPDAVACRADCSPWLVCVTAETWCHLLDRLAVAERGRGA